MPDLVHATVAMASLVVLLAAELLRAAGGRVKVVRGLELLSVVLLLLYTGVVVDRISSGLG